MTVTNSRPELSPTGMPLPFERAEYVQRMQAARAAAEKARLDAVLLFHQESMYYLSGYDQLGYWVYQTAILVPDRDELVYVARRTDADVIDGLPTVGDVRVWLDDSLNDPATMTVDVLGELGVLGAGRRIGVELRSHALLPYYYRAVVEAVDGRAELVDASNLIADLRVRKSDAEIAYTRKAGRVVDAAYAAVGDMLRPGVTEAEVLASAMSGMFGAGGCVPAIVPPLASGPRTVTRTHGAATQRVIEANEILHIEPGGCVERYHAVGVQCKWVGDAPVEIRSRFANLLEALDAGRAAARPGVGTADVARAVNDVLRGYGRFREGSHVGYGTGIGYPPTWLDHLRLKETDTNLLEANMVFFMFVHETVDHGGAPVELFVGEPIVITQFGCDRLTTTRLSLDT